LRKARVKAKKAGHDGIIIHNVKDNYNNTAKTKPHNIYAVFSPEQIKSATNNRGTFDGTNPDIRFSLSENGKNILNSKEMNLRERIDHITNASEIELAGEAYKGKYELNDGKSIKKFILDKLHKIYTNTSTGKKINVSRQSARELLRHIKDDETYQKSLAHIPQIIENMQFLEEMKPDKDVVNPKFNKYSYYITPVNIDGKSHTILSTIGYKGEEIYYDQNVFKGTLEQTFTKARTTDNAKYSRLKEILKNAGNEEAAEDRSGLYTRRLQPLSNNKYTKNPANKQDESQKIAANSTTPKPSSQTQP